MEPENAPLQKATLTSIPFWGFPGYFSDATNPLLLPSIVAAADLICLINVNSHRIHVWYIYLHFMVNVGKYHTRILWDYINEPRIMNLFLNDALMTPTALEPENTTDAGVAIIGIADATTKTRTTRYQSTEVDFVQAFLLSEISYC